VFLTYSSANYEPAVCEEPGPLRHPPRPLPSLPSASARASNLHRATRWPVSIRCRRAPGARPASSALRLFEREIEAAAQYPAPAGQVRSPGTRWPLSSPRYPGLLARDSRPNPARADRSRPRFYNLGLRDHRPGTGPARWFTAHSSSARSPGSTPAPGGHRDGRTVPASLSSRFSTVASWSWSCCNRSAGWGHLPRAPRRTGTRMESALPSPHGVLVRRLAPPSFLVPGGPAWQRGSPTGCRSATPSRRARHYGSNRQILRLTPGDFLSSVRRTARRGVRTF